MRHILRGRFLPIVLLAAAVCATAGTAFAAAEPELPPLADPAYDDPPAAANDECLDFFGVPLRSPGGCWVRADYLFWWTRGIDLPPLVTTSPPGTPPQLAGVQPDATVLFGDDRILDDGRSGLRTAFGMYLDACQTWGIEADYLTLGNDERTFSRTSGGDPILARPFYNVQTGQPASVLVAYPGVVSGTITATAHDSFYSTGALLSYQMPNLPAASGASAWQLSRFEVLGGFRHYNLSDSMNITEVLNLSGIGTGLNIRDTFRASNDFYGAELGLRGRLERGRWSFETLLKLGLGNTHRSVNIGGQTVITAVNQPTQTFNEGLFAVQTNNGSYHRDSFTVIPQLSFQVGWQLNDRWRTYLGYDVLYWGRVARAVDQIDLDVDPRNFPPALPGATHFPEFRNLTNYFWAQGLSVGAEFRF